MVSKEKAYPYKKEGEAFRKLIVSKGSSPYSLAMSTRYGVSKIYRLCSGEESLRTVTLLNIVRFARFFGYKTIEDFYLDMGIDLFKETN